jgi:hypothetical protein
MLENREFHPKLGRLKKSLERLRKLFVAQVLAAARRAGHVGRSWPARSPATIPERGEVAAELAAWRTAERRL